jgi:hypothetical protein
MTRSASMFIRAAVCVSAFVAASLPLSAQATVFTNVDSTQVTVGDRITFTVLVDHEIGARVVWPDSLDLDPFEVLEARAGLPEVNGERERSTAVLSLTVFELGVLEIPSFELEVLSGDGSVEVVSTRRYGIQVLSVGADETGDIRGIRGPMAIAISVVRVALFAILLVSLLIVAYQLFRRFRRRPSDDSASDPGPPLRPAHELALEALDRLAASPMLDRGQVKEYHIEISDVLRRYVEARFGVPALEMTTWEVVGGLEREGVEPEFRDGLRSFLDRCDLVKFAKVRPDVDSSRSLILEGRSLVERSARTVAPAAEPREDA